MLRCIFTTLLLVLVCVPGAYAHEDVDDRIAALDRAIAAEPRNASLYTQRADLHRLNGDMRAAERDYRFALELDPTIKRVYLGRALLFLDGGHHPSEQPDPDRALEFADDYISRAPDDPAGLTARGEALAALGRVDEAVIVLLDALAHYERVTPDDYIRVADIALKTDDGSDAALAILDAGIEKLGPAPTLQFRAIDIEVAEARYDEALARIDTIEQQFQRKELLLEKRGDILRVAGRHMEADAEYTLALEAIESLPVEQQTRASIEAAARLRAKLKREGTP